LEKEVQEEVSKIQNSMLNVPVAAKDELTRNKKQTGDLLCSDSLKDGWETGGEKYLAALLKYERRMCKLMTRLTVDYLGEWELEKAYLQLLAIHHVFGAKRAVVDSHTARHLNELLEFTGHENPQFRFVE